MYNHTTKSSSSSSSMSCSNFAMMQQRKQRMYSDAEDDSCLPLVATRRRDEIQRSWSAPSSKSGTNEPVDVIPKHHQHALLPTTCVVNKDYYDHVPKSRRYNYYNYNHNHNSSNNSQWPVVLVVMMAATVLLGTTGTVYRHYQHQSYESTRTLQLLQQTQYELSQVGAHARQLESRLSSTRQMNRDLEQRLVQWQEQPRELERAQQQLQDLQVYQERLHTGIQSMSRRMTVEKFGPGPHYYVELRLAFDPDSNVAQDQPHAGGGSTSTRVVLETASLEEMPHTVHLFLEQVAHGLYDGTVVHRNAPHILQAGPSPNPDLHERFRSAMDGTLHHVVFQEYTPEWNHAPYTIGYAGRPGGPDFYVNLRDNANIHGPGGQAHHYDDTNHDADPCFARVVEGADVMDRIHRSNNRANGEDTMEYYVTIQHMHILEHYRPASQPSPKGFEPPPALQAAV